MAERIYPINIWINEERDARLREASQSGAAREVLAGLKVISLPATEAQKEALLARFPSAKCDTSTTGTIELLPRDAKDRLFALVLKRRTLDVVGDFLRSLGPPDERK